ncbi:MAG: arginyltransferase [Planctomycetota bacterium]
MNPDQAIDAQTAVDWFLDAEQLPLGPEHECPYLPDRTARCEAFFLEELDPEIYTALMGRGFRRSYRLIYRPACEGCDACQQLRVPVAEFSPSRSQRRVWRRNGDLRVTVGPPELTDRKWRMFEAYLDFQHDELMSRSRQCMAEFLYESPVATLEICYLLGDELVAVSIVDRSLAALSSVYVYFAPQHSCRSPGTFSVLWEIDYCRRSGIPYYYLGYYVRGSRTMDYKIRFRPCEILDAAHTWIRQPSKRQTSVRAG